MVKGILLLLHLEFDLLIFLDIIDLCFLLLERSIF